MNVLRKIEITEDDWIDAGNTDNRLRQKGITVPLPDLIIFIAAENNNCTIFTLDKQFEIFRYGIESRVEIISKL